MATPRVSLEQWRILHTIISEGGFAQAARKLNKSQSAVSYAISKMQEQLGLEILTIKGRKAELTDAGELLLRRSRHLLEEASCLEAAAQSLYQGWEPELTLAAEILFPVPLLMRALDQLGAEAPHTRVEIVESVMSGTDDMITNRKADLAICVTPPAGFFGVPLMEVQFDLVTAPSHPLAQAGVPVTPQMLSRHRQIIVRDSGINRRDNQGWQRAEQRWTFSHQSSATEALLNGYGFSWAPLTLLQAPLREGRLVRLEMETPSERRVTLHLVKVHGDSTGSAARCLHDILQSVVEGAP
ncbi:LysR family transcriptional regulator [Sneathiella chinensis]|uniref:LysR family transcriptional regulator n=1 Tax=Sneathiella chinensis TaxID=349750 RepID=A0ABQ5U5L1_9PROT|nr:LysR family transcriptional regulator [Sneathiella chinensis]GLQ07429.1 LysR family transcriptional regulator [Sneathiella chinensis]